MANSAFRLFGISKKACIQNAFRIGNAICERDELDKLTDRNLFKIILSFKLANIPPYYSLFYRLEPYIIANLMSLSPDSLLTMTSTYLKLD